MHRILSFFTGRQNQPSTDFSQFIVSSSSSKKKQVVKQAVAKANEDQLRKVAEAKASD